MAAIGKYNGSWSAGWGGYMTATFTFSLTCTANDDLTNLHVHVDSVETPRWDEGWKDGGGFINVGGLCSPHASFSQDTVQYMPEDWSQVRAEVESALGHSVDGAIFGCWASDDTGSDYYGEFGALRDWDIPLSGTLPHDLHIVSAWLRWMEDYYGDDEGLARVASDTVYTITIEDINWDYYPAMIKKGSNWKSADRIPDGSFKAKRSNSWTGRRNSDNPSAPQTVFVKKSNSWVKAAKIGSL